MNKRSPMAEKTVGITLDHAAVVYDWLSPMMTLGSEHRSNLRAIEKLVLSSDVEMFDCHSLRVLDLGCGTGTLTRMISDRLTADSDVIGIDAAEKMIEVADKKKGDRDNLRFKAALAEDLPFDDESFDRAVSTFFFHHINGGLKAKVLQEMWRVLRPGGLAVIVDVDMPYNLFGKICAWSGYRLFNQPEILENIEGKLREELDDSLFESSIDSRYGGYISLFILKKIDSINN
jgi:ubiquinone/menaquinone biosynthesis C-methylase UbiE